MIVPEGTTGRPRQIQVTLGQVRRWAMAATALVCLALFGLVLLLTALPRRAAWRAMADENAALRGQVRQMEALAVEVGDAIQRLHQAEKQLQSLPVPSAWPGPISDEDLLMKHAPPPDASDAEADDTGQAPAAPGEEDQGLLRAPDAPWEAEDGEPLPPDLSEAAKWAVAVHDRLSRALPAALAKLAEATRLADAREGRGAFFGLMPRIWPVEGVLTSAFGYRRSPITRRWQFHSGIDIGAPRGSPVLAPAPGLVVRTATHRGWGRYLEIDHGGGVVSRLNHNAQILVSEGDRVNAGQVVATVGSTGWSTGPHCHYTILVHGEYVDPLTVLPQRAPT